MHQNPHKIIHDPVLLGETIKYINPKVGEKYLDVTAGYGGHARSILELTKSYKESVLVDRDARAIEELKVAFSDSGLRLIQQDFLGVSSALNQEQRQFDIILADLGVSSLHLNEGNRGFSFNQVGPLDMRMDQTQEISAWNIVNQYKEESLANLLWQYGQEPKSRQIAKLLVARRPIMTTSELAAIVKQAWPGHSKSHPATRTFQAIRIAVNDELNQLSQALPIWLKLLSPGGRLAVISFHSLEDRIVKQFFASQSGNRYDALLTLLTKHPITPKPNEIALNPRSRSAKLRVAAKQK